MCRIPLYVLEKDNQEHFYYLDCIYQIFTVNVRMTIPLYVFKLYVPFS